MYQTLYHTLYKVNLFIQGIDSRKPMLRVNDQAPSFKEPGDTIMEKVAETHVVLPCDAQGSPPPRVRWFKNGLEIHPQQSDFSLARDGSLVIGAASASHSGDYKCVATNDAGSVQRKTRLKVNVQYELDLKDKGPLPPNSISCVSPVPPEIPDDGQPVNLTVTLKQPLTLGCDAFGIPSPSITWTKDGHSVDSPGVYLQNGNRLLRIYRVQSEHGGQFACTAENTAGEARRAYNIVVQAPPVISGTPRLQKLAVVLGQEVEFQCRVSGRPAPRVEWSRDGEVLSRDGDPHVEFLEEGQVLRVKSVRLRDQGLYQCLARNNAGTQTRQFRLTVQAPPSSGALAGPRRCPWFWLPTVLPCDVEGSPAPSITWLKDNHPIVPCGWGPAQGESAGLYTCRASNPAGSAHIHYSLSVLGSPPPRVRWFKNGLEIHPQQSDFLCWPATAPL
ncbi:hypothetical protein CRUP_028844 [Coryphaenoides rupestris]|nr:hypothetical protein CRUP_028844 [Coryphaenoides rupestris]